MAVLGDHCMFGVALSEAFNCNCSTSPGLMVSIATITPSDEMLVVGVKIFTVRLAVLVQPLASVPVTV